MILNIGYDNRKVGSEKWWVWIFSEKQSELLNTVQKMPINALTLMAVDQTSPQNLNQTSKYCNG